MDQNIKNYETKDKLFIALNIFENQALEFIKDNHCIHYSIFRLVGCQVCLTCPTAMFFLMNFNLYY